MNNINDKNKMSSFHEILLKKNLNFGQKLSPLDNIVNNEYVFPQKVSSDYYFCSDENEIKHNLKELKKLQSVSSVFDALALVKVPNYILNCSKYIAPNAKALAIVRYAYNDDNENRFGVGEYCRSQLSHCHNVWLCPLCRSMILSERSFEISKAFKSWTNEGGQCYMLTLTARHTPDTRGVDFVPRLKKAYVRLRNSRVWRNMWKDCGCPTNTNSVIGNYEFTFGSGGIHPHRHLLLFMRKSPLEFSERLLSEWVRCCANVGLESNVKALDFSLCKSSAIYISKIGFELTNSSFKKESLDKTRLDYFGLCQSALNGKKWAIAQLQDFVFCCKGLRALHWSKGLKDYFKIKEVTDDEISNMRKKAFCAWLSGSSAKNISSDDLEGLVFWFNVCRGNLFDPRLEMACKECKIDLYNSRVDLIHNYGMDKIDDVIDIRTQFRLDYKDGDFLMANTGNILIE